MRIRVEVALSSLQETQSPRYLDYDSFKSYAPTLTQLIQRSATGTLVRL